MKAYTIEKQGVVSPLTVAEPELKSTDVLIDIKYVGLCGSDLSTYRGKMPLVVGARIPGHEISGVVVAKGADVPDSIKIGANATLSPYTNCGVCPACMQGRDNTCEFNETLGVQREGALTEKVAVPYEKVFASDILSLEELVLVEPLSVGYHSANRARISEIDTVLILGCGTIGMGALCAAHRKGATVIVADIDDSKLERAKKFGADYTINSMTQDIKQEIAKLTNNRGVDAVIEAIGLPQTIGMAIDLVSFAGRVAFIGYAKSQVEVDTNLIVRKELDVMGSRNALRVFPSVINMFEKKTGPFEELITKIFPLDETAEAFKFWDENPGIVSKIVIDVKK